TPDGDLTVFLRSYFDTAVGSKADAGSYARIAETMRLPAGAILFVSDVVPELDAAAAAGMHTTLSIRPGNAAQPRDHGHPTVSGFDEIPSGPLPFLRCPPRGQKEPRHDAVAE